MTYPYFLYPVLKELESATDPERKRRLRALIAANIYSPEELVQPIEGLELKDIDTTTQEGVKSGADILVDSFIEKFGRPGQKDADAPLLPETATPADYFATVGHTKEDEKKNAEKDDDWQLEVKNLIKIKDYSAAISIITEKYLNNPEKSIYFADQIRFIKKMMLNEERKQQ